MRRRFFFTFVAGSFAVSAVAVDASLRPSWFRRSLWGAVVAVMMFIAGCANSLTGPSDRNPGDLAPQAVNLINGPISVGNVGEDHPFPPSSFAAVAKVLVPGSELEISVDNLFQDYKFSLVLVQPGMYPGVAPGMFPGSLYQLQLGLNPVPMQAGGSGVVKFILNPSNFRGMSVNEEGAIPVNTVLILGGRGIDNKHAPQSNTISLKIETFKDLSGQAVSYPAGFQAALQAMPNPLFQIRLARSSRISAFSKEVGQ